MRSYEEARLALGDVGWRRTVQLRGDTGASAPLLNDVSEVRVLTVRHGQGRIVLPRGLIRALAEDETSRQSQ